MSRLNRARLALLGELGEEAERPSDTRPAQGERPRRSG
jgi:hypothetical protein